MKNLIKYRIYLVYKIERKITEFLLAETEGFFSLILVISPGKITWSWLDEQENYFSFWFAERATLSWLRNGGIMHVQYTQSESIRLRI